MPAGAMVPIRPTIKQEQYCRKAIGINRFCYNLAVATHRFHRVNRLPWPSWQDIYKAFNACKHEDYPFVTEVASRVAEGAFMDFGRAIANWRNPEAKARAPEFKRKKLTGTGSFRAASGVTQIRYNGKRRIQLPGLGSGKLDCTLPKGIYHEAHIKQENGHWRLCLKLWRAPQPIPENDNRRTGAVDTGINPMGTDSDGQEYQNPQATYQMENKLRRWQRAQAPEAKGLPRLVGSPTEDRPLPPGNRGPEVKRPAPDDQHGHQEVPRTRHRRPHRGRDDARNNPQGPGRRRDGRGQAATHLQKQLEIYRGNPGSSLVSQQQDLQRLPRRERETQAGTDLDVRELRNQP